VVTPAAVAGSGLAVLHTSGPISFSCELSTVPFELCTTDDHAIAEPLALVAEERAARAAITVLGWP
jgi:hypothetical protein